LTLPQGAAFYIRAQGQFRQGLKLSQAGGIKPPDFLPFQISQPECPQAVANAIPTRADPLRDYVVRPSSNLRDGETEERDLQVTAAKGDLATAGVAVTTQTLPAPLARPPSESATLTAIFACSIPVCTSNRTRTPSPQLGDQMLSNANIRPEHGALTLTTSATVLLLASTASRYSRGNWLPKRNLSSQPSNLVPPGPGRWQAARSSPWRVSVRVCPVQRAFERMQRRLEHRGTSEPNAP